MLSDLIERLSAMKARNLIILGVGTAVLLFGIILFVLSALLQPEEEKETAAEQETHSMTAVVAKSDIPARSILREDMLKVASVPENELPQGALTHVNDAIGRPVRVNIRSGETLTDNKLYQNIAEMGFAGVIPSDCRAVSVNIDDTTGVAGFIKPGDRVDVMLIAKPNDSRIDGEILLQNVLLLGINKVSVQSEDSAEADDMATGEKSTRSSRANRNASSSNSSSDSLSLATLALPPDEALKLAVGAEQGKIYLTLCPYHPSNRFVTNTDYTVYLKSPEPVTPPEPTHSAAYEAPVASAPAYTPPAAPVAEPAQKRVEVIRGTVAGN